MSKARFLQNTAVLLGLIFHRIHTLRTQLMQSEEAQISLQGEKHGEAQVERNCEPTSKPETTTRHQWEKRCRWFHVHTEKV